MDSSFYAMYGIGYAISALAQLVILTACIILLIKRRNLGSILLFLGCLGYGLVSIFGFVSNIVAARSGPEDLIKIQQLSFIAGSLSYLIFGIGLILVVLSYLRQTKPVTV